MIRAMTRARADAVLFLVAFIWGTTFVAQKESLDHVGPVMFVALRFLASAVFLAPLAFWETRRAVRVNKPPLRRADWLGALVIGSCLCAGCWSQQYGLKTTTAGNAGFLTAVYMVLVPFLSWAISGHRPRTLVLGASAIALCGAWLLAGGGSLDAWSLGDIIILAGDIVWALHITLISHFRGIAGRPLLLSFLQCVITGLVSLPIAIAIDPASGAQLQGAIPSLLYAGILSGGIAYTLQIVAQSHTPPGEAALILSLESVFSAVAGAVVLREMMGLQALTGALLILVGVVLVEAGPMLAGALGRRFARLAQGE